VFLSECWLENDVDIDDNLIIDQYNHLCIHRKSFKGGGFTLIYKKELNGFLRVEKVVHDSILWIKLDQKICSSNVDTYVGFVYIPHENNVFYKVNDVDI
jgi:hypothetical protein